MTRKVIATTHAPQAIGPYSQAIEAEGWMFCSGQIGLDPKTQTMVEGGLEPETRRVLDNLKAVLEAGGLSLGDVVRTTIYLTDLSAFSKVNAIYAEYFGGDAPPARATVEVSALPKGALVEIDAMAFR